MTAAHLRLILLHPAVRGSLLLSGTVQGAIKEIEALEAENFVLAAGQRPMDLIVMDPWGNPRCAAISVVKEPEE